MVALLKPREPRHYSCGPLSEDRPLKLYEPPAKVPWWVEVTFAAGFVAIALVDLFAFVVAWGNW